MMRLGRRREDAPALSNVITLPLAHEAVEAARRRDYAQGLAAGTETTLRLLLGEAAYGGKPCPGPVPENVKAWASQALANIERF